MNLYELNKGFVSALYDRIQLSVKEAVDLWKTLPGGEFVHNVITLAYPNISAGVITHLAEIALRSSLEREESEFSPFSLVLEPPNPDEFGSHFKFRQDIDFTSSNLTKLSKALDPNNYHIGIWFKPSDRALNGNPADLVIWGFKPKLLWFLTVNSFSPGKISLGCLSGAKASFKCLMSLAQTGFIKTLTRESNPVTNWVAEENLLASLNKSADFNNIFARMFRSGLGGTVLLVRDHNGWKESIESPMLYEPASYIGSYKYPDISDKYKVLGEFEAKVRMESAQTDLNALKSRLILALERSKRSIEDIYTFTTIDGATILSESLQVLAFGAKIASKPQMNSIAQVEPFEDSSIKVIDVAQWNVGTRHKSAAKFVFEQKDCLAIVSSQDRRLSIFSWNDDKKLVQQLSNFDLMVVD